MAAAKKVLEQALALPEAERWELVSQLMRSLEEGPEAEAKIAGDEEWRAAWTETIQRRVRSIDDGTVEMLDGDEVLAEMHALAAAEPRP